MKYLNFILVKLQPWSDMNCRGAHSNIPLRNIAISLKEHLILNQHVDFILKCMALDPPKTAKQRKVNITHSLILAALLLPFSGSKVTCQKSATFLLTCTFSFPFLLG